MIPIRKNYTDYDREIIINCVKESPSNLKVAFEIASRKLKRSTKGIEQHYYKQIASKQTVIAVASELSVHVGKNAIRREVNPSAGDIKEAMVFAAITQLSKEKVIDFLFNKLSKQQRDSLFTEIVSSLK
jgi:hypothetical protein